MIPGFRRVVLHKFLGVPASMDPHELAYLALTGKIELPFGNRLAWLLQLWAESRGLRVTREWACESGKHADIAVLKGKEPEAILELKSMFTFDPIRKTESRDTLLQSLKSDIHRWSTQKYATADVFGVLLAAHPRERVDLELIESHVVRPTYLAAANRALDEWHDENVVKSKCNSRVIEFFDAYRVQSVVIPAGRYFETDVEIVAWLIDRVSD